MLYHTALGFPAEMKTPRVAMLLDYTGHAYTAAETDAYGAITLPSALDTRDPSKAELIEVEYDGTQIVKALWRVRYDDTRDLLLVVLMQQRKVKTVWLNVRDDLHTTLDESRYSRPEEKSNA